LHEVSNWTDRLDLSWNLLSHTYSISIQGDVLSSLFCKNRALGPGAGEFCAVGER
jgi:hypothetical protein